MSENPDAIRADIEATRARLGTNVDASSLTQQQLKPTWSDEEVALLAGTLGEAVERLASDLAGRLSRTPLNDQGHR